jgi:hypothetical protein
VLQGWLHHSSLQIIELVEKCTGVHDARKSRRILNLRLGWLSPVHLLARPWGRASGAAALGPPKLAGPLHVYGVGVADKPCPVYGVGLVCFFFLKRVTVISWCLTEVPTSGSSLYERPRAQEQHAHQFVDINVCLVGYICFELVFNY